MQRILICIVINLGTFSSGIAQAIDDGFHIGSLPKGKEVTLPRPAVTFIPGSERIQVSSTDMPQTLKLSNAKSGKSFRVAIYDTNADKVKHVELKPGATYMYNFQNLGSISLVPEGVTNPVLQTLRIESNKPLSVSR